MPSTVKTLGEDDLLTEREVFLIFVGLLPRFSIRETPVYALPNGRATAPPAQAATYSRKLTSL